MKLDYETNPTLDIIVGVKGTELTRSFSIPVTDVPEPEDVPEPGDDEPLLTGVHSVGAQLGVSVAHNRQIVIESVEWTRQGEDDVLSDIEIFRAETDGTYQVTVTYWVRLTTTDAKQPSKTWTRTISIAPPGDAETAGGSAAPRRAFDPEEPYDTGQGEEAASSPLPDIA